MAIPGWQWHMERQVKNLRAVLAGIAAAAVLMPLLYVLVFLPTLLLTAAN